MCLLRPQAPREAVTGFRMLSVRRPCESRRVYRQVAPWRESRRVPGLELGDSEIVCPGHCAACQGV